MSHTSSLQNWWRWGAAHRDADRFWLLRVLSSGCPEPHWRWEHSFVSADRAHSHDATGSSSSVVGGRKTIVVSATLETWSRTETKSLRSSYGFLFTLIRADPSK